MDKKIIILKITLIVILLIVIFNFDYCIYMFIKNDSVALPNSVNYVENDMFNMAKNFTDTFFTKLEKGKYDEAFDMLHENCKKDLFDYDLARFTKVIESKYFNKQIGNKYYVIEESKIDSINTDISFHAYYNVNVLCESKTLEKTSDYYKSRVINADVVKKEGEFKLILTFEEDKKDENTEEGNK